MPSPLPISILFTGLFALTQVPLTVAVGLYRLRSGIQFLDGGDVRLTRLMRAHGNFVETVPMALLAMAAAELAGAPRPLLLACGSALAAGRCLHYVTILRSGFGIGRAIGMATTLATIAVLGSTALFLALREVT